MVNMPDIMNNLQTMGPVFWAGAAAIALGGTLLLVSIFTMLRRIKISAPRWKNPALRRKETLRKTSQEFNDSPSLATARKTESGYEPTVFPIKSQETISGSAFVEIPQELTDRLHRAGDTLEEIIQGLQKENYSNNFSELKGDTESVEYLFKTTVG